MYQNQLEASSGISVNRNTIGRNYHLLGSNSVFQSSETIEQQGCVFFAHVFCSALGQFRQSRVAPRLIKGCIVTRGCPEITLIWLKVSPIWSSKLLLRPDKTSLWLLHWSRKTKLKKILTVLPRLLRSKEVYRSKLRNLGMRSFWYKWFTAMWYVLLVNNKAI